MAGPCMMPVDSRWWQVLPVHCSQCYEILVPPLGLGKLNLQLCIWALQPSNPAPQVLFILLIQVHVEFQSDRKCRPVKLGLCQGLFGMLRVRLLQGFSLPAGSVWNCKQIQSAFMQCLHQVWFTPIFISTRAVFYSGLNPTQSPLWESPILLLSLISVRDFMRRTWWFPGYHSPCKTWLMYSDFSLTRDELPPH